MRSPRDSPLSHEVVLQRLESVESGVEPLSTKDLSYREVRDSLWLAGRIDPTHTTTPHELPVPAEPFAPRENPVTDEKPRTEPEPPTEPEPFTPPEPRTTQQWTPGPRTMTSTGAVSTADRTHRAASAWPTVPAMPDRHAISRALRPLTRTHPSPWHRVVDEEATAIRAAQDKLWVPEWKAAPWRRFDVALVIDAVVAGSLWRQTTREFRAVLERQGAFKDVRVFELNTDSPDLVDLSLRSEGGAIHDWGFLVEPNGTRIVLVLTGTVGKAWHSGSVSRVLHAWSQRMPVAIVHTLPPTPVVVGRHHHASDGPVRARSGVSQPTPAHGHPHGRRNRARTGAGPVQELDVRLGEAHHLSGRRMGGPLGVGGSGAGRAHA
jgi:hypothetical protein